MIIEEEEIRTEIKFFDKEESAANTPEQGWRNEDGQEEYSLLSIDEEEDPNDLEIQSFSFDFDNKKKSLNLGTYSATPPHRRNRLNSISL